MTQSLPNNDQQEEQGRASSRLKEKRTGVCPLKFLPGHLSSEYHNSCICTTNVKLQRQKLCF
jgi:hypothetical protein